jgi:hypothetical protein
VMCPDCDLSAKLTGAEAKVSENGKCVHRQNPLACPTLMPLISALFRLGERRSQN